MAGRRCQSAGVVACRQEGVWREDAGDVHAGRRRGLLGADIDACGVSALRVREAAIVMVVAVPTGPGWVNPTAAEYRWALIPIVPWAAEHQPAPTWRPTWQARPVSSSQRPFHHGRCRRRRA
jgi:hypothetical protein